MLGQSIKNQRPFAEVSTYDFIEPMVSVENEAEEVQIACKWCFETSRNFATSCEGRGESLDSVGLDR